MPVSKRTRAAATAGVIGFTVLFIFQVALALGAPLGKAAFGGKSADLTPELRAASAVSALLIAAAVWALLVRAGKIRAGKLPRGIARPALWFFAALFSLSAFANFASSSPWERYGWGPFAVGLVACCVIAALEPKGEPPAKS